MIPLFIRKLLIHALYSLVFCRILTAQEEVLFTIGDVSVSVEEFNRTYNKNNNFPGAENIPVEEYLERYINFRLKVLEAENRGYDTVQSFIDELAGYREQLARPYLQDKMVMEQLVQEAYQRTVQEVNVSHILMLLPDDPAPEDTIRIYRRVMDVRERLQKGEKFEDVALEVSEDPSVNINKGNLGWIFAFVMEYSLENVAFKTESGGISMPVRAAYGYHLIKVNDKREALGEVRLAHIMVRADTGSDENGFNRAEERINQYYEMVNQGQDFGEVARMHSEDAGTSVNNGQMRWLRSGELPSDIEAAVFMLSDSGSYTQPLRSIYGWHIFQLLGKRSFGTFQEIEAQLMEKVTADERIMIAEEAVVSKMKERSGFIEYTSNIDCLAEILDSSAFSGQGIPVVTEDLIDPVFIIDGTEFLQRDLIRSIMDAGEYSGNMALKDVIRLKCDELINEKLIEFRKEKLEDDYPEFKHLLQEYHDGILLFNISDDLIWQQAVDDTAGLRHFFEVNSNNYLWGERADVSTYHVNDLSILDRVRKYAKRRATRQWTSEEVMQIICQGDSIPCITIEDKIFQKGDDQIIDQMRWKKGETKLIEQEGVHLVIVISRTLPVARKNLSEIRGMVVADYQDYLERQWVSELRGKYPVSVNNKALKEIQTISN